MTKVQSKNKILWISFLFITAILLAYGNSFNASFQFDDYRAIVENPIIQNFHLWIDDLSHGIRPLLKLSYFVNWKLSSSPFGFHLFNAIIHCINAILVFLLVFRLLENANESKNNIIVAIYCSLLFSLHPIQTETVTYITGRSMGLMSLFYLLSLITWLQGIQKQSMWLIWVVSPVCFCFSLFTRETAITLPLLMVLIW